MTFWVKHTTQWENKRNHSYNTCKFDIDWISIHVYILPCSIVYAHCLLPGRAFASLYVLLFLEKEAEIGGRVDEILLDIGFSLTGLLPMHCVY